MNTTSNKNFQENTTPIGSKYPGLLGNKANAPSNITTAYGNEELAAIEALLRSAEIPYRLCDRGAGGIVRVISGYTMYGTDVFVRAEDVETARELLTPVDAAEAEEEA